MAIDSIVSRVVPLCDMPMAMSRGPSRAALVSAMCGSFAGERETPDAVQFLLKVESDHRARPGSIDVDPSGTCDGLRRLRQRVAVELFGRFLHGAGVGERDLADHVIDGVGRADVGLGSSQSTWMS